MTDFVTLYCETCRKPFRMSASQRDAYAKKGYEPRYCKQSCQPKGKPRPKRRPITRTGA